MAWLNGHDINHEYQSARHHPFFCGGSDPKKESWKGHRNEKTEHGQESV